ALRALPCASLSSAASEAASGMMALAILILQLLSAVLNLILSLYLPSALTHMTLYLRFGAGFEIRENIDFIRRNPKNYFLAFLASFLANLVAGVGILDCVVGATLAVI